MRTIITLTTDFGSDVLYTGQVKGAILSINPKATIVDLQHRIKNYNILEGAFFLSQVIPCFPADTIHLAIIDPGVGTKRKSLIIKTNKGYLIGPDNGLFSLVLKKERIKKIIAIEREKFKGASTTFQGRDIFARVAALLSTGKRMEEFGRRVERIEKLTIKENSILFIDNFGNIITNIKKDFKPGEKLVILHRKKRIKAIFGKTFADVKKGEFVVLKGSSGLLEVDQNQDSAAANLSAKIGEEIKIKGA